jgi:hypothetical protein
MKEIFGKLTNSLGTITGILTALSAFMVSIGCAPGATDFAATCAVPWLPPAWMPILAGAFGVLTLLGKMLRPGGFLHSLFGGTAVIVPETSPSSGVGTVTPEQVKTL